MESPPGVLRFQRSVSVVFLPRTVCPKASNCRGGLAGFAVASWPWGFDRTGLELSAGLRLLLESGSGASDFLKVVWAVAKHRNSCNARACDTVAT